MSQSRPGEGGDAGDHGVGAVDVLQHGRKEEHVVQTARRGGMLLNRLQPDIHAVPPTRLIPHGFGQLQPDTMRQTETLRGVQCLSSAASGIEKGGGSDTAISDQLGDDLAVAPDLGLGVVHLEVLSGSPSGAADLSGRGTDRGRAARTGNISGSPWGLRGRSDAWNRPGTQSVAASRDRRWDTGYSAVRRSGPGHRDDGDIHGWREPSDRPNSRASPDQAVR
jgi:hypothetical protein